MHTPAIWARSWWTNMTLFWTKYVPEAWDTMDLTTKLIWLFFFTQTICVLTLVELLALGGK